MTHASPLPYAGSNIPRISNGSGVSAKSGAPGRSTITSNALRAEAAVDSNRTTGKTPVIVVTIGRTRFQAQSMSAHAIGRPSQYRALSVNSKRMTRPAASARHSTKPSSPYFDA
ncbi:hypothetical protein [Burkholderia stagnalis]|uniref:hypothetical protein n=1 Tax=Burkholderia stagnalis TaxID=1503054 RepID=UPI0012D97CFB|nr:hypothetical protein [Burkholderia stagnalis]